MAEMGALRTILLETLMVAFLLMDSKVFNLSGCRIEGLRSHNHGYPIRPFEARIQIPWHLTMHHRYFAFGERANAYCSEQS